MKKDITIKDIAQKLGIHHATVSRALKGSKKVKEETRNRILEEVRNMGYTPNLLAQNFRNGRTNIISFIIPDLKHHFFSRLISCITELAREKGVLVMIFQSNDNPEVERDIIQLLISMRVAGVAASVGLRTQTTTHFNLLAEENIPLVFFDRVPQSTLFPTITLDNHKAMKQVVSELVLRGKKRIAYISYHGYTTIFSDRLNAYRDAIHESGLDFEKVVEAEQIFIADGYKAASCLFLDRDTPDAIICINDEVAIGVIRFLKEKRISVPDEVSVVGFDDNPMGLVCEPELATFSQSIELLSHTLLDLLLHAIEYQENEKQDIVLPLQLELRDSL